MRIEKYWWLFFIIFLICVGFDLSRCHVHWLGYVFMLSWLISFIIGYSVMAIFVKVDNQFVTTNATAQYIGFVITASIMDLFGFCPSCTLIFVSVLYAVDIGYELNRKSKKLGE